jgi:23S rRNA G2445 N2-methylase RlmL
MSTDLNKFHQYFVATCPTHIEPLLEKELKAIGVKSTKQVKGAVEFEAYNEKALEVVLRSRLASRVFRLLYSFDVENEHELYFKAKEIKWKAIMDVDQTFKIKTVLAHTSRFKNSLFLSLKVKDAIADWFVKDAGRRPDVEKSVPDCSFLVRIEPKKDSDKETVVIGIDLSGFSLNQRGYRTHQFEAPLKENLAAAIIDLIDQKPDEKLVDLMTGSGTLIFESLIKKYKLSPSYLKIKEYAEFQNLIWDFQNHQWFAKDKFLTTNFEKLIKEINQETIQAFQKMSQDKNVFIACDIDRRRINELDQILSKLELKHLVDLVCSDATLISLPQNQKYLLICNPPYGERMGEEEKLEELYHQLGEHFKTEFKGSRAFIFSGNFNLLKKVSLRTSKKYILHNGKIECRLAEYQLY